jgi:quinolinate synthase
MDSLEALLGVCAKIGTPGEAQLHAHRAGQYTKLVNGRSLASAGCKPILHMRNFQATKALPEALVKDILSRVQQSSH